MFFLGHHLTKHVISEHKASSVTECAQYCLRKSSSCKSINYKSRQNQDSSKNCQLNNATKSDQPQNLMVNDGYNYYETLLTKVIKFIFLYTCNQCNNSKNMSFLIAGKTEKFRKQFNEM